jgi:hypothetical protein
MWAWVPKLSRATTQQFRVLAPTSHQVQSSKPFDKNEKCCGKRIVGCLGGDPSARTFAVDEPQCQLEPILTHNPRLTARKLRCAADAYCRSPGTNGDVERR